jgi:superfamily II DNA/RNA helicase
MQPHFLHCFVLTSFSVVNLRPDASPPQLVPPMERFIDPQVQEIARSMIGGTEDIDTIVFSKEEERGRSGSVFITPKPFQRLAIPYALAGMNMVIASETGSGKTLVFAMAIFKNAFPSAPPTSPEAARGLRALVIVPSGYRQLVEQHTVVFKRVAQHLKQRGDPFWSSAHVRIDDDPARPTERHGVASSSYTHAAGGGNENRKDRDDDYSTALIRIDTPDRIEKNRSDHTKRHSGTKLLSKVSVIAMDEVDKIFAKKEDHDFVEAIVRDCQQSQIVSASATMARPSERLWPDRTTAWLQSGCFATTLPSRDRRPFISVQTENVLPPSVFHLFVDLSDVPAGQQRERARLAWEQMHSLNSQDDFPHPCFHLWNVKAALERRCAAIQDSFSDMQVDIRRPKLVCLTAELSVGRKARELLLLKNGNKSGCIATQALATGMDYSFRSVILSRLHPNWLLQWDAYTHASGRCGRRLNELGMCVIFIETPVRFPVFCSPGVFSHNL